jgi:hypothetical protein
VSLFTGTSVAVDVLPSRFHTLLIVGGQMQLVFFVGVVVRRKCVGHRRTQLPYCFRAVVPQWLGSVLKHNIIAAQFHSNPLLQSLLPLPSLDCDAVGVNIIQAENVVIDGKDTFRAVANYFPVSVVAPCEREPHSTHKQVGFGVGCDVAVKN